MKNVYVNKTILFARQFNVAEAYIQLYGNEFVIYSKTENYQIGDLVINDPHGVHDFEGDYDPALGSFSTYKVLCTDKYISSDQKKYFSGEEEQIYIECVQNTESGEWLIFGPDVTLIVKN